MHFLRSKLTSGQMKEVNLDYAQTHPGTPAQQSHRRQGVGESSFVGHFGPLVTEVDMAWNYPASLLALCTSSTDVFSNSRQSGLQ